MSQSAVDEAKLAAIRQVAQADPVPNLTKRWGELASEARRIVARLEDKLRELEQVTADLASHDLQVATALGATGDAARAAFVTTEEHKARHDHDFTMPKGAAA